jgi:alkylation response protein AidB-like acyl-CoA dehydrogenase
MHRTKVGPARVIFASSTFDIMHFQLTEEHLMIQQAARDFARAELLSGVIERDDHQKFPADAVRKMGELGFMGMMVSPEYQGSGMDTISYVLAME